MNGRVVEIEYAKGWGRVLLEDGRVLTFDSGACIEGIPDRDAHVTVTLVPARLGGEKIGRLTVRDAWVALPDDVPYLVAVEDLLLVRDGAVVRVPRGDAARAIGETGYAVLETKQGELRVRSLLASALRANELDLFKSTAAEHVERLKEMLDDAALADIDRVADELVATIHLANMLRRHVARHDSN